MADLAAYGGYEALKVTRRDHGVLDIVMSGEGANRSGLATANARMHREPPTSGATSTAIPTRASRSFAAKARASAGGDLALVEDMANDFDVRARVWREARDLVYNVINCSKPIVSAMHGPAVGAGPSPGCSPTSRSPRRMRASSTATRGSASRPATMRRSCGRCCAGWRRRSTT